MAGCHLCFGAPTLVTPACAEAVPLATLGCVENIVSYTKCHLCFVFLGRLGLLHNQHLQKLECNTKYHMSLKRTPQYKGGVGSLLWHKR